MNNKLIYLFSSLVFLGIIGGSLVAYYYFNARQPSITTQNFNPIPAEQTIGGDTDEHGCLIAAGYSWCNSKSKCLRTWEEPCSQEDKNANVSSLINNLINQTQVELTQIGIETFTWNNKDGSISIDGYLFEANSLDDKQYQDIFEFFENNDFNIDQYNVAAGVVGASTGFSRDNMKCIVSFVISDYDPTDPQYQPTADSKKNVQITCGYPKDDKLLLPESAAAEIAQLLADKHQKKFSEISVTVDQESENHIRGSVQFQPVNEPGNGGWFLAAKVNGNWKLVFDGNGTPFCDEIASYNFPADMIEGYCAVR
jgi:hypothetical protein